MRGNSMTFNEQGYRNTRRKTCIRFHDMGHMKNGVSAIAGTVLNGDARGCSAHISDGGRLPPGRELGYP